MMMAPEEPMIWEEEVSSEVKVGKQKKEAHKCRETIFPVVDTASTIRVDLQDLGDDDEHCADGQRDSRIGDDTGDCLCETTDDETDETLGQHCSGDVDRLPMQHFLPKGRVLKLASGPEREWEQDGEGRDDDICDFPNRAGQYRRPGVDARFYRTRLINSSHPSVEKEKIYAHPRRKIRQTAGC